MENKIDNIFSNGSGSPSENISTEKYLTFFIEDQLFALKSSEVVEIIRMQPITFMPKLPPFVKGVINLRGKIVPLIDLRLKLGKPALEYDDQTSIIISETDIFSIGFIVDRVNDVTDIAKNQISPSPKLAKDTGNNYVNGIATLESGVALMLDAKMLLTEGENDIRSSKAVQQTPKADQ